MLEQQPAKLANSTTTTTQEPILSSTMLASCPVAIKDFHRKFLVEAKRNCYTEPDQLSSAQGVLQAKVDRLQYIVDVLTRYLVLPVAHMVGEPTLFPEAHYVWPKVFGAETGPLSFQTEDLADNSVSTREYGELDIFQTKFCARCLRPGHVANECFAAKDANNNELKKKPYGGYGMMSASAERFGSEMPHSMAHRMEHDSRLIYGGRSDYGYHPMDQGGRPRGYNSYEEMQMDRPQQYVGHDRPQQYVGHDMVPVGHNNSFAGRGGEGQRSGMAGPERGYGPGRGSNMNYGRGHYQQAGRGGRYGRQGH